MLEGIGASPDGPVRTGLALANHNDTAATMAFFFINSEAIHFGTITFPIVASLRPVDAFPGIVAAFTSESLADFAGIRFGEVTRLQRVGR